MGNFWVNSKNERRNPLVGKYIADFYFVNILLYNNKKYVSNTSVKSVKKHNDGKKGDFKWLYIHKITYFLCL